jgi:hypothetical protein
MWIWTLVIEAVKGIAWVSQVALVAEPKISVSMPSIDTIADLFGSSVERRSGTSRYWPTSGTLVTWMIPPLLLHDAPNGRWISRR